HWTAEQAAIASLKQMAEEARARENEQWLSLLPECGDTLRPEAREGKTGRLQVIARTYTLANAAKRLGVRDRTLEQAIREAQIQPFPDPEEPLRLPALTVEAAFTDPEFAERITAYETLTTRDISIVCGVTYNPARRRLQRAGIKRTQPRWGDVRGKWNLPQTLREFY